MLIIQDIAHIFFPLFLGNHVEGEIGEFAITKPIPSLPLNIWGDKNNEMFKKAYFSKFPGEVLFLLYFSNCVHFLEI